MSFSKLLVPLLNSELDIIPENSNNYLEFEDINVYDSKCDCVVCKSISLKNLKKAYCGDSEKNYYAKILIYLHNVLQYDYICEKFKQLSNFSDFEEFIKNLPKCSFKENMTSVLLK